MNPILVVDDDPINLAALRQILEPEYKMVFARTGKAAIEIAAKHKPSLILLDIQMPDMDGYAVCRHLKATMDYQNIPVIFVTSLSEVGNEEAGFSAGCVDYLTKPFSPGIVRARVKTQLSLVSSSQLEKSHRDAVFMLGEAAHYNDTETGGHIWRMAEYSRELAHAAGWSEERCNLLELAAPMHDTGKIGIPDEILRKPGTLDAKEWSVMQSHTTIGFEILSKSVAPVFKMAAEIALHHHEKWDGSGYPHGLAGENIPESARIIAVADVFDALSCSRPYKDAWPMEKIMHFFKEGSGQHFDPMLVGHFIEILPQIVQIKEKWH